MTNKPSSDAPILFKGTRFNVIELQQQIRGGGLRPRQVVQHPGAVLVLPLLEGDRVCLIRNERVAIGTTLIELPAGTIEPPAPPTETAVRELKEETGYTAKRWRELPSFYTSPGFTSERMFVFVAEELTAGAHQREEGENIDNYIVAWSEALAMVDRGEIEDGKTITALLMWERLRNKN